MRYVEENARIWDRRSENHDEWSIPVFAEEVALAREGRWHIVLTPTKPVPAHWFPQPLQGNMQDLSAFADGSFDCIVHPWSNGYIDDVKPVWRECARVLKKGGLLLAGFGNPISCIFNVGKYEQGILQVENAIPYADIDHLDDPATRVIAEAEGYLWGHTLEDQIQGQIDAGFALIGFYEDIGGSVLDRYIHSSIAAKAVRL